MVKISEYLTFPCFDLVLLGMGTDGHTASLFPGSAQLEEKERWVAAVSGDTASPPVPRITLTLPVFNQARNLLFLISGDRKKKILDSFLNKQAQVADTKYPAARVQPKGSLTWIVAEEE